MVAIPRRQAECSSCALPLTPGIEYLSSLYFEKEEWVRKDFCTTCGQEKREGVFWRGKIPLPQPTKKPRPEEKALAFLRALYQAGDQPKLVYLLALYLQRQKVCVLRTARRNLLFYEIEATGELFEIERFFLSDSEGKELAEILYANIDS